MVRRDGKRQDGATLHAWVRGKPLAWDITVPDTHAQSHVCVVQMKFGLFANVRSSAIDFERWPRMQSAAYTHNSAVL